MPDPVAIMNRVNANLAEQGRRNVMGNAELPGLQPIEPVSAGDIMDAPTMVGKALTALKLSYEPLRRATQASREAVLWAGEFVPRDTFRKRASLALSGKAVMSSRDFTHILFGNETWKRMEQTPLIPGWFPAIAHPEQTFLQRIKKGQVSMGDLATLGAEVLADPFSLMALTPEGAGIKLRALVGIAEEGKIATGLKFAANPPWFVSTRIASRMFSPGARGPLSFLNLLRQPEDVIPSIFPHLETAWTKAQMVLEKDLEAGAAIAKSHGLKYNSAADQLLDKFHLGLVDTIPDALKPVSNAYGDLLRTSLKRAGLEVPEGEQVLKNLVPRRLLGTNVPIDIWQSWRIETLGKMTVGPMRDQVAETAGQALAKISQLPNQSFSLQTTARDLLYAAAKKSELEPALVRFAPKIGRAGEDALTSSLSRVQRRYLTDVINLFTGNGRGRKMIEFDYAVLEHWQKLAQSPVYNRVKGLFEKLGYGTVDDMPDFSPTTKLAGLMTHSVALNALGGRLRSAIVNSTQVTNYGLVSGIPAMFKGMFHQVFQTGELKGMRKGVDLLRSYHDLWREDIWLKGLGQKWSDALMSPFNVAENFIRGTGFNIGIDTYAKLTKQKIGQMSSSELDKAISFARFESLNGAFVYGTLGRPPALSNPLIRPFTTLLSFPFKQGEFLRRTFVNDGSAFARFIGLHGFMIEKANEWGGAAAEDFLGWGFTPMTRSFGGVDFLTTSPAMRIVKSSLQGLIALGDGDPRTAEAKFNEVKDTIPMMNPLPILPWLAVRDIVGNPATGRTGLIEEWRTNQQKLGDGIVPIARQEMVVNFLVGRSTTQAMRSSLRTRTTKSLRKIDHELDQRAKRYVRAAHDHDGDQLASRAWDLVQPIDIEGKPFYPDPQQIESRVQNRLKQAYVSRDILAMQDNRFLQRVYLWSYMELLDRVKRGQ